MNTIKKEFGVDDKLQFGLRKKADDLAPIHPIEASERNFQLNRDHAEAEALRRMQGFHAPLRIQWEKNAVSKVGHLPCITQRSNFQRDILEGNDELINFNDILGQPENYEGMIQPHDVIEDSLRRPAQVKKVMDGF